MPGRPLTTERWTSNVEYRTSNVEWKNEYPIPYIQWLFLFLFSHFDTRNENRTIFSRSTFNGNSSINGGNYYLYSPTEFPLPQEWQAVALFRHSRAGGNPWSLLLNIELLHSMFDVHQSRPGASQLSIRLRKGFSTIKVSIICPWDRSSDNSNSAPPLTAASIISESQNE